jgi:hypothetical protein
MIREVEKWDFFELELRAQAPGNPFPDVNLEAEFTHNHRTVKVTGFYDGEGIYRARFMPDIEGAWLPGTTALTATCFTLQHTSRAFTTTICPKARTGSTSSIPAT